MFKSLPLWLLSFAVCLLSACQSTPPAPHGLSQAQVKALEDYGFTHIDNGMKYDLSGKILFATDSSELSDDANAVIAKVSTLLIDIQISHLRLDGHTDNQGRAAYNLELSERRAAMVAKAMIANGIPTESIVVRGLGDTQPIADNGTEAGRSENRRVTIIVGTAASL
ncbi:OmpA family protein [Corticibacter populi]|nr:OmpA family protein [Corticibacter populi]RZS30687.1 OmpA family protein [Corticibacter populi]